GRTFRAAPARYRGIHVQPAGPRGAGGGDPTGPASHHARPAFGAGGGAPGAAPGLEPFGRDAPGLTIAPIRAFAIVPPAFGSLKGNQWLASTTSRDIWTSLSTKRPGLGSSSS